VVRIVRTFRTSQWPAPVIASILLVLSCAGIILLIPHAEATITDTSPPPPLSVSITAPTTGTTGTLVNLDAVPSGGTGTYTAYQWTLTAPTGLPPLSRFTGWHQNYDKSNFAFVAHNVASLPSQSVIDSYKPLVGYLYITNGDEPNPYNTIPPYLSQLVEELGTNSPPTSQITTGLMISLYIDPTENNCGPDGGTGTNNCWDTLVSIKNSHTSVPIVAIINPSSGPGTASDSVYVTGINKLRAAGITVLGYLSTQSGTRSISDIKADIDKYKSWYNVNGIFFDEMSNESGNEKYYTAISSYAKSTDGFSITFGNAGTDVPESYIGTVDTIEIYEDSGSTATLSDPTIKNPTFTPDAEGNYQLDLTVTDSSGATANAPQVTVAAKKPLSASIAAPTTGTTGTLVNLDVFESGGTGTYIHQWTLTTPPGSTATLSSATIKNPTFTPDIAGNYQLDLVLTDSSGATANAPQATITVTSPPPPLSVSITAPTSGTTGTLVTLGATVSNGHSPYTYAWALTAPSGSTATLSSATDPAPTFTPDIAGSYQLDLTVTDSSGGKANAPQATITVTSPPPPLSVSITAPTSGTTGTLVTLGATVSNGHSPYTYAWALTAPSGSTATLSSATDPAPTFTPDIAGSYQLDLTVTDSSGGKANAPQATITVTSPPPPLSVSITAPTSGTTGTLVTLGATVSNGHSPYTYAWALTAPSGSTATLSSATDPAPTFTPDIAGSYQLDLTVTDSSGGKANAPQATITVTSPPPKATSFELQVGDSNNACEAMSGTWDSSSNTCTISGLTLNSGNTLTVDLGVTLIINGSLVIDGGTVLNYGTINSGGNITNKSGGTITNSGTINNSSYIANVGTVTNSGTINSSGYFGNGGKITNNSGGTISNSHTLNSYGIITNSGTITNTSGGTMKNYGGGKINNLSGGTITNSGTMNNSSYVANTGTITNSGTINNSSYIGNGGTITNLSGGTITNSGTINSYGKISNSGTITNNTSGTIKNYSGGKVNNNSGGIITNNSGGTITNNSATITNSGTINNSGAISGTGTIKSALTSITNTGTITDPVTIPNTTLSSSYTPSFPVIVPAGVTLTINSGQTLTINSGVSVSNFGTIKNTGILSNSGTITSSGTISNTSIISNSGTLNNSGYLGNGGTITNNSGGTLSNSGILNSYGTISNSGIIMNNSGGTIKNYSGGKVNNNSAGTISNSGTITNTSTIYEHCGSTYSGSLPSPNGLTPICP